MSKFREALSQIWAQCESAEFQTGIKKLQDTFYGRPLVLYGAGDLGSRTATWLSRNGISADCFCDRSRSGIHADTALTIVSPQELLLNYKDANTLICSITHADDIRQGLLVLGIPEERIFFMENLPIHGMMVEDFLPHVDGYEWAYNFFTDDTSKAIILNRVEGYLLSTPIKSSTNVEYFDNGVMTLGREEVFVDGGMFNGDTAVKFIRRVAGQFRQYYGFEIDATNYRQAAKNLKGIERVTLLQKGLWSSETELRFNTNLSASSKLSESGDGTVQVTSLDTFFADLFNKPTLIKLDIEGAEKEALLGAKNIIKSVKPKLAICAYHKPEDIYELPKLLAGYGVGYKFALRHYSDTLLDTVMYAV
ncbi:MAG: hypothetical protein H6Q71_79 [Firmicutes bacterium]|nr:hypothetical protein [Bacillota bacterium]